MEEIILKRINTNRQSIMSSNLYMNMEFMKFVGGIYTTISWLVLESLTKFERGQSILWWLMIWLYVTLVFCWVIKIIDF